MKRRRVIYFVKEYFKSIGGDLVGCATYGKIKSKSALKTTCRGLAHVPDSYGNKLASMIPTIRGNTHTLTEMYYGTEEVEKDKDFINAINKYDGILETAMLIENLKISFSEHPAGVFAVNKPFYNYSAVMKTKTGLVVSQYDLHDGEDAGLLKYDMLVTTAQDKIRNTLNLLIENNKIEEKDTLRDTYESVLHPQVLNYNRPEIWEAINTNSIVDAFQFATKVAKDILRKIKPDTLTKLSQTNSLMRLQKPEHLSEDLTTRFLRYNNNIQEWYNDMDKANVPKKDQKMLETVLLKLTGVAENQEALMKLVMLEGLSNFDVAGAHAVRSAIAKKNEDKYNKIRAKFYEACKKNNVNINTATYVWEEQISASKGYSFSNIHSNLYSLVLLAEAVLNVDYPPIYWQTSTLLVNSGSLESEYDNKKRTVDYGKIATALSNLQFSGVNIAPPYINQVEFGFTPDEEHNRIIMGLKSIVDIGDREAHHLLDNTPYENLDDIYNRLFMVTEEVINTKGEIQNKKLLGKKGIVSLIKSGALDYTENIPREEIMTKFLLKLQPNRKSLGMNSFNQVYEMSIIPEKYSDMVRVVNFRSYINDKFNYEKPVISKDKQIKSKKWHLIKNDNIEEYEHVMNFFEDFFIAKMKEQEDYYIDELGLHVMVLGSSTFEKLYKEQTVDFMKWLNSEDSINKYNKIKFNNIKQELASGTLSKWEMDSMNIYIGEHELSNIDLSKYKVAKLTNIVNIEDYTKEELQYFDVNEYKGVKYIQYPKSRIAGTCVNKNNAKHTITLLCDDEIIDVKFSKGAYNHYNQQVTQDNGDGTSTTLEKSWFQRGTLLIVTGYRNGIQYKANKSGSTFMHSVMKLHLNDGEVDLQVDRVRVEE